MNSADYQMIEYSGKFHLRAMIERGKVEHLGFNFAKTPSADCSCEYAYSQPQLHSGTPSVRSLCHFGEEDGGKLDLTAGNYANP